MRLPVIIAVVALAFAAGCGGSHEGGQARSDATASAEPPPISPAPETRKASAAVKQVGIAPGTTSLVINGTLDGNTDAEFLIGEEKGTVLMAHALTPDRDLDVSVYRADTGARLADESPSNPVFFMARLPETLGYLVAVRSPGKATPYSLEIEVPRQIVLDEKTSSAQVTSSLPAHGELAYLVPAGTITAELVTAPQDAYLTAHGLAGAILLKAAEARRTFTGTALRPNEEIVVIVNQGASDGDVTLAVTRK